MVRKLIPLLLSLFVVMGSLQFGNVVKAEQNGSDVSEVVKLIIVEKSGFVHPGISVDPEKLENTRQELMKGNNPWISYYNAMKQTKYASLKFESANLKAGTIDTPKDSTFKKSSANVNLSSDGFRAYTQAVLYYLTGDSQYRYNAIRLVRIWENMNPNEFQYFADSHIHVGTPFYYMVSAAELLRYTTVVDEEYNDEQNGIMNYNLTWTEEDTNKLTKNLIDPVISTFLYSNYRYMNQHLYPVIGAMAGYIFKDDKARYEEAVEWAMVNSTTEKPDINGALKNQFHLIEANDPRNPTGVSYIQHLEMGRDQAHGTGDVIDLTGIARILNQQKTKIDPVNGTVSTAVYAQTPYAFLNQRILEGAEKLYSYMGGYTIPWTDLGYPDFVKVSEAYRGRTGLFFNMSELYDAYRYMEGMTKEELEKKAPQLSFRAKHLTSPNFYNGSKLTNFWGSFSDNKMTEIGCEYWLSIPSERSLDKEIAIPAQAQDSSVSFVERGAILDKSLASVKKEEETTYIRLKSAKNQEQIKETDYDSQYPKDIKTIRGGNQIALPSLIKINKPESEFLSLRIRSTGTANLLISSNNYYGEAFQEVTIPNTHGEWKYIVYNTNGKKQISRTARQLANLDFYSVISDTDIQVDFDRLQYINADGGLKTNVPTFKGNLRQVQYLLKKVPYEQKIELDNADNVTFSLVNAPKGMTIDSDGTIKWTPDKKTDEPVLVTVVADNGVVVNTAQLNFVVSNNHHQAYEAVLSTYNQNQVYTQKIFLEFSKHKEEVETLLKGSTEDRIFLTTLNEMVTSINALELLNPKLADGTFNYYAYDSIIPSVTTMNKDNIKGLVDNDTATFSGDLRAPSIFDFGPEYKISAKAFSFQARRGLPNRSEGMNVYGSNDGVNWILLTETVTTNTEAMETIRVKESLVNESFRYLKFQVDYPGIPTDPAYPGISSFAELRIDGTRNEVNE
ncbi:putative Ig domain-containing protein [Paenibacillus sedimenti]|uniref:Discoidin domain-containing protein n=1 Tax=Paenibacillus sedimenti TaxID=2770274 RepID=A0A926QKW9_9BACL|nr:putative Ig domain-containing protein [Paenibacillus sedimenti]MBD0381864.1 hypothetical protein [Paenibacillus sedimenti]